MSSRYDNGNEVVDELTHRASDPVTAIAIAEGILVERYQIPTELGVALLIRHAATASVSVLDAARWLVTTRQLP